MSDHIIHVTSDESGFTADATWLPGCPPVARGYATEQEAILALQAMVLRENVALRKSDWYWPSDLKFEVARQ